MRSDYLASSSRMLVALVLGGLLWPAVSTEAQPTGLRVIPTSTAPSFVENFEGDSIDESVWQIATWTEHGGQTGRERTFVQDGYLHMHFVNSSTQGWLNSSINSRTEYLFGRWEARLKPSSVAGVLNSFFTIDWDDTDDPSSDSDGTKQEIDIEFLTKSFGGDSGEVHFAVHQAGLPSFNLNPDIHLDFDPSADFHVWGFEITPDYIQWFVDETVLLTYVYAEESIRIDSPYMLKLNTWTTTGGWIGGPPPEDVVCEYLIDWIRFTPLQ
jgi:beta-glucanase (GH16 family)